MAKVFISYSHEDEVWKMRLQTQLAVLEMEGLLSVWEDRQIAAGDDWKPEIEKAIDSASVALLLISAHFLTSKFIRGEEVPRMLNRRKRDGLRVIPLILKPCVWKEVTWLAPIQARPTDNKPLSGFSEHEADAHLCALAEEVQALIAPPRPQPPDQDSGTDMDFEVGVGADSHGGTTSRVAQNHHEQMVVKQLQSAGHLFTELKRTFADEVSASHIPRTPAELIQSFRGYPAEKVEDLFVVVRRALLNLSSSGRDASTRHASGEAATGLYCMAACRLVNREAREESGYLMYVPLSENVVYAVIVTALFGGELRLVLAEQADAPQPEYVFDVPATYGGDQLIEDFERAAYVAVFENRSESSSDVSKDTGPLTEQQRKELAVRLRSIKRVNRASLALVVRNPISTEACKNFAANHQIPVMLPTSEVTTALIGMDAGTLLAHIREFWGELQEYSGPTRRSSSQLSTPPPQAPRPMSSHTHHYYAPVAQSHGDHSQAQAGDSNAQNMTHVESPELSSLSPLLQQLMAAIGDAPTAKARSRLNEHLQVAQLEVDKNEKADANRIKSALVAIKSGAEMLENGGKIITLCNKAYQTLATLIGWPYSPLP